MGHLGLTPQSIYKFGTYEVRAKETAEAKELVEDAKVLDRVGVFAIVLEKIPTALAAKITDNVSCATIGIGAGAHCDGQVLVTNDMLGMNEQFHPRFVRTLRQTYGDYARCIPRLYQRCEGEEISIKRRKLLASSQAY